MFWTIFGGIATATGLGFATLHYRFGLRPRSHNLSSKALESHLAQLQSQQYVQSQSTNTQSPNNTTSSIAQESDRLPTKFSILCQNTWCSFFAGGPSRQQRLQILIDEIKQEQIKNPNLNILCFQEVFLFALGPLMGSGDFEYLTKKLCDLGYIYYSDPKLSLPKYIGCNNGLVTYSKQPFEYKCNSFLSKNRRYGLYKGWIETIHKLSVNNKENANLNYQENSAEKRINRNNNDNGGNNEKKQENYKENKENKDNVQNMENMENKDKLVVFNTHFEHAIRKHKLGQIDEICDAWRRYDGSININSSDNSGSKNDDNDKDSCSGNGGSFGNRLCLGDFNICSNDSFEEEILSKSDRLYSILTNKFSSKDIGLNNDATIDYQFGQTFRSTKKEPNASYDHIFYNDYVKQWMTKSEIKDYKDGDIVMSDHFGIMSHFDTSL